MSTAAEYWYSDPDGANWGQVVSETHLPWRVDASRVRGTIRRNWLHDLSLINCACGPGGGERTQAELRGTPGEYLAVLMIRSGRETVEQHGITHELSPGSVVIWDSRYVARYQVWQRLAKRSLIIPVSALREIGVRGHLARGVVVDSRTAAAQLLTDYMQTLSSVVDNLPGSAITAARYAALEVVSAALQVDNVMGRVSDAAALRLLAQSQVDAHLEDSLLEPAWVAARLGVSLRTLQRAFAEEGETLAEYIRDRRLARARDDLVNGRESVAMIAATWQFSDASHLARSMRRRYGMTPTQLRESMATELSAFRSPDNQVLDGVSSLPRRMSRKSG